MYVYVSSSSISFKKHLRHLTISILGIIKNWIIG